MFYISCSKMFNSYKFEIEILVPLIITILHGTGLYGAYYLYVKKPMLLTCIFACIMHVCAMLGMTAGAHRLWSHKSYKAKLPLRVMLIIFQTLSFQFSALEWARMHRMHHKYCDTDADPHNSSRGFFFSHIGWVLVKEHADVKTHMLTPNDLYEEKLLIFQDKYYYIIIILLNIVMPIYVPTLWGESPWIALYVATLRQLSSLHASFLINSVAHRWGSKPYDKNINPTENRIVSFLSVGEGFHNYHHTFPWDYKTAELGGYHLNFTKLFIDMMAKVGWAYDLKTVSNEIIKTRAKRTGDGTHAVWGWDDQDLSIDHKMSALILQGEMNQ